MTTVEHADLAKTRLVVALMSTEHHSHETLFSLTSSLTPISGQTPCTPFLSRQSESQRNYRRERHSLNTMPASHLRSTSSGCSTESRCIHILPTNTCLLRTLVETRRTMELLTRIAPRIFYTSCSACRRVRLG